MNLAVKQRSMRIPLPRARFLAILFVLFALSNLASAQHYSIRVAFNTNLRSSNSLQGDVVATASAGSVLQVIGESDRWLRIKRNGNEVWMAGWVSFSRVEGDSGAQTSAQLASAIDNCCFVDRQCHSDQEWTDGYWAYQNGHCAAPTQSRRQPPTQSANTGSAQVDNCCDAGWQCHSDSDWASGFQAFQRNQCEDLGVDIEGSGGFVAQIKRAFDLLKKRAPHWYNYAITGLDIVRQDKGRGSTGVYLQAKLMVVDRDDEPPPGAGEDYYVHLVLALLHEACHVHHWQAGIWYAEEWRNELTCHELTLEAISTIDPDSPWIAWDRNTIANYKKYHTWWGAGPRPS